MFLKLGVAKLPLLGANLLPVAQQFELALVPDLPRFDLPFAFTIIHGIGRLTKIKMGKAWEHSLRT